jgi:hypothetical protein
MLQYYYHGTIRRVIVAFASMFNNIHVSRKDANGGNEIERIKVPIAYGPRQKFLKRLERIGTSFEQQAVRLENYLPRISFEIGNLQYDSSRKLNSIQQTVGYYDRENLRSRYERVPYNLFINLSVMAKSMEDNLQIVEQIVPYFTPEYVFTLKLIEGIDDDVDIPVVLTSVNLTEGDDGSYGDYAQRKVNFAVFQFTAKIYLYGPVNKKPVITQTDINIFDGDDFGSERTSIPRFARMSLTVAADVTAGSYNPSLTGNAGQVGINILEYPPEIDGITGP